jgi:uncharacterized membrane protein YfcA
MGIHLLLVLIFFLAGLIQGVTGFGSALVAMPLLLLFLEAKTAVPLCILNGLVITAFLSLQLKQHMDWKKIMPLFAGCIPGILAGVTLLKKAENDTIKILLATMLVAYASYSLRARPRPRHLHRAWSVLAGFATGAIGAAFSAGGPPAIIYTALTGWPKDAIKATLSGFFFVTGILMVAAHAVTGLTTAQVLHYFFVSMWAVLSGTWIGSLLYGRLSREKYMRVVFLTLFAMGLMMIASAL